MTFNEEFPILPSLLAQKPAPIQSPWSTCELRLTSDMFAELDSQVRRLPRYRFDRYLDDQALATRLSDHAVSARLLLGLVLTIAISEHGRRDASEGHFWTLIARRFEACEFYTRLFTSVGQPTSLCRELLEQTARAFRLRHIYGQEGHHSWYASIALQFGFTRKGFERRLAEWLAGQQRSLAVEMLLEDPILRSSEFFQLWDALWSFRRGNRSPEQARTVLAKSCWILPEWIDSLLRVAKERRELDSLPTDAEWEPEVETTEVFLNSPLLVWNAAEAPFFQTEVVRLADLALEAPEYAIRVGQESAGRLLRQSDGTYRADGGGRVRLPVTPGLLRVELVSPLDDVVATQEFEVSDPNAEATLFDAQSGTRVIDGENARLVQNHRYLLLVSSDLVVHPTPVAVHRCGDSGFKLVALPAYTAGVVSVALEDEPLWEWSILPKPQVDTSEVKLIWGNYFDDGHAGVGYARLILPGGWELRRARKDFRNLEFKDSPQGGMQSDVFTVTPDDHVRDVRIDLHLRHSGRLVRKSCRLAIPTAGVLWQRRGQQDFVAFDSEKPLYAFDAQHDRFLFRLMVPKDLLSPREATEFYRRHVLIEGAFFHRRLGQKPVSLGQLHGFGQPLLVKDNSFNAAETVLKVAVAVIDTGILASLRQTKGEAPKIALRQPIYPGQDHQLVMIGRDLCVSALPFTIEEGTKCHRLVLPADCLLQGYLAVGLFYRGIRLGSIWNHPETGRLQTAAQESAEQALRVARLIRVFKFPLLSPAYESFSRTIALKKLMAFVTAWRDEEPVAFDGIELKSPGLDEAAANAFAEMLRLDPLELDGENVDDLVDKLSGGDPLKNPEPALTKVTLDLMRLSPRLAGDVVKHWHETHAVAYPRGTDRTRFVENVRTRLLSGQTEQQLLTQVSHTVQADENFVREHLRTRWKPNWKFNVRAMQHLLPFRMLLTRAFLNGL